MILSQDGEGRGGDANLGGKRRRTVYRQWSATSFGGRIELGWRPSGLSVMMDMLSVMMSDIRKNNDQLKAAVCQGLVEAREEARRYTDVMCASLKRNLSVEVQHLKAVAQEVRACREELAKLQQTVER